MRYPQLLEHLLKLPIEEREKQTVCIIGPSALIPEKINNKYLGRLPSQTKALPVTVDSAYKKCIIIPQIYELSLCLPKSQMHLADINPSILEVIEKCVKGTNPPYDTVYPFSAALKSIKDDFKDGDKTYPKTFELFTKHSKQDDQTVGFKTKDLQFHEVDIAKQTVKIKKCHYVFATKILRYPAKMAREKLPEERKESMKTLCKNVFQIVKIKGKVFIDRESVLEICKVAQITENFFADFIHDSSGIECKAKLLQNEPTKEKNCVHLPLTRQLTDEVVVLAVPTGSIYEFTRIK